MMRKYFAIIATALLALASSLLAWKLGVFKPSRLPHYTIDVAIEHVNYTRYNSQGKRVLTIHAPKLTHNSQSHTVTISQPHIINQFNPKHRWNIWADQAQSDEHYKKITLNGHVKMQESSDTASTPITLSTQSITILPKRYAYTRSTVLATQGLSSVKAQGARLNFKTNTLQLLGNTDLVDKPAPKQSTQLGDNDDRRDSPTN